MATQWTVCRGPNSGQCVDGYTVDSVWMATQWTVYVDLCLNEVSDILSLLVCFRLIHFVFHILPLLLLEVCVSILHCPGD